MEIVENLEKSIKNLNRQEIIEQDLLNILKMKDPLKIKRETTIRVSEDGGGLYIDKETWWAEKNCNCYYLNEDLINLVFVGSFNIYDYRFDIFANIDNQYNVEFLICLSVDWTRYDDFKRITLSTLGILTKTIDFYFVTKDELNYLTNIMNKE